MTAETITRADGTPYTGVPADIPYLALMRQILDYGVDRTDRTGTGRRSLFGAQMRFDLRQGFPLLTTKRVFFRGVVEELLWFLSGSTNAKDLQAKDVHIWDAWATAEQCARFGREEGDLGRVYGAQWTNFGATRLSDGNYAKDGVNQIARVVENIRRDPHSTRHLVTAWDPRDIDHVALPPCHSFFQFFVSDGELSCQMYQRTADVFLGVPWNIACYALLTRMVAQVTGLTPGDFVHTMGDAHLYLNHLAVAKEQLVRRARRAPRVVLNPDVKDIFAFRAEDIVLEGYDPHPAIKAEVSV